MYCSINEYIYFWFLPIFPTILFVLLMIFTKLQEGSPLEMLRQFAVSLKAELREDFGASRLFLDNENGKGSITLYQVFPGLTAWIYNITFEKEYNFVHQFSDQGILYFGYNVLGHQFTKYLGEKDYKKISKKQNFILSGDKNTSAEFKIPKYNKYQSCYLIIEPNLLEESKTYTKAQLKHHLSEIFSNLGTPKPYRYFGDIDFRTGLYADVIVKNERTDLVGRLLTEGAILNMLASQIEAHDNDIKTENLQPNVSKEELLKISELGDFIQSNLSGKISVENLSNEVGISSKKLQAGVRFLFGHSVNEFITNIRLERSRELFNTSSLNVSEICYKIGYNSRSYFSKQFQDRYGILPKDYRDSLFEDDLLFEISYRSMAKENITNKEVEEIVKISKNENKKYNITGSLIYHRNVFFQLIEGSKKEVLELYTNIKNDNRHFDVQTIWQGSKPNRDFKDWSMAVFSDDGVLKIPYDGDTEQLSLGRFMGQLDKQSLESKNLWRNVRNVLKISNHINEKEEGSSDSA